MVQLTDVITFKGNRYMVVARTNEFKEIEKFGLRFQDRSLHFRVLERIGNN